MVCEGDIASPYLGNTIFIGRLSTTKESEFVGHWRRGNGSVTSAIDGRGRKGCSSEAAVESSSIGMPDVDVCVWQGLAGTDIQHTDIEHERDAALLFANILSNVFL